jgi:hypothetical protein
MHVGDAKVGEAAVGFENGIAEKAVVPFALHEKTPRGLNGFISLLS